MTSRRRIASLSLLLLLSATALQARPERPLRQGQRPSRRLQADAGEPGRGPDEMRKTLGLMFIHRARIELNLSDEQALRLLPLVEKVEQLRHESGRRRGGLARQLEDLAEQPTANDEEVLALVRALDQEEERSRVEQARVRAEMMALLTPQQKARFFLFAHRFRGAVEDQVHAMRRSQRPGGPGRPPGGAQGGSGPEGAPGERDLEPPPPEP